MNSRATALIRQLELQPHPKGGFYRETFRSTSRAAAGITAPAHWWQAARPRGACALCSCTVAPGFEFEDFSFLRDHADARAALQRTAPELVSLL